MSRHKKNSNVGKIALILFIIIVLALIVVFKVIPKTISIKKN